MHRQLAFTFGALVAVAACSQNGRVGSSGGEVATPPVNRNSIPSGTPISVRLNESLGTSSSHEGDRFSATVSEPVIGAHAARVVPAGAMVYGHVSGLYAALPPEQAVIRLAFDSLTFNGSSYRFDASISSVNVRNETTGAAGGAVVGAIISGGETRKMISGGLLGAADGSVISLGTGGTQSVIPAGSSMMLRSTQTVLLP
jgi:hypothetical protein